MGEIAESDTYDYSYPVGCAGAIKSWPGIEMLLRHIFENELKVKP